MPSAPEIYTLSLHDALPISRRHDGRSSRHVEPDTAIRRDSGRRLSNPQCSRSEEHTSELQSLRHLVCRLPQRSTLFPYTTLFRSLAAMMAAPLVTWSLIRPSGAIADAAYQIRSVPDRKSTRLNSSHLGISYAVCPRDLHSFPTRRSSDLSPP